MRSFQPAVLRRQRPTGSWRSLVGMNDYKVDFPSIQTFEVTYPPAAAPGIPYQGFDPIATLVASWEELDGSPNFDRTRTTMSAQRIGRFAEADMEALHEAVFPGPETGQPFNSVSVFPGMSYLVADHLRIEPWHPESILPSSNPTDDLNVSYAATGWKATIDYKTTELDYMASYLSYPAMDVDAPGHSGNMIIDNMIWTTWKNTTSAEYYTLPPSALVWADLSSFPGPSVKGGVLVAKVDHHLTWHFVNSPPRTNINGLVGTTNKYTFLNAAPGTLLLLGADITLDALTPYGRYNTVSYKFSEKDQAADPAAGPKGWTFFLRPDQYPAVFQELKLIVSHTGSTVTAAAPLIAQENFALLLEEE